MSILIKGIKYKLHSNVSTGHDFNSLPNGCIFFKEGELFSNGNYFIKDTTHVKIFRSGRTEQHLNFKDFSDLLTVNGLHRNRVLYVYVKDVMTNYVTYKDEVYHYVGEYDNTPIKSGDILTHDKGDVSKGEFHYLLTVTNTEIQYLMDGRSMMYKVPLRAMDGRRKVYRRTQETIKPMNTNLVKKENTMKESIMTYVKENKNIIMTVVLVIIIDKLVFKGAFTNRLKGIVERFLGQAEEQLEKKV
jgi:hypothetical protein